MTSDLSLIVRHTFPVTNWNIRCSFFSFSAPRQCPAIVFLARKKAHNYLNFNFIYIYIYTNDYLQIHRLQTNIFPIYARNSIRITFTSLISNVLKCPPVNLKILLWGPSLICFTLKSETTTTFSSFWINFNYEILSPNGQSLMRNRNNPLWSFKEICMRILWSAIMLNWYIKNRTSVIYGGIHHAWTWAILIFWLHKESLRSQR
jgi:hypothetical protein